MSGREQGGLILAATARIYSKDGHWVVPSQKQPTKTYRVNPLKGTCTCKDHADWGHKCKHIYAVEIVSRREGRNPEFGDTNPYKDGEEIDVEQKRPTYKQNWPAYNLAQTTEKHRFQKLLFDLCKPLVHPPGKLGRPRLPLSEAVFAVVFKGYSTVSMRRFMCDLEDAKTKGYLGASLHFNAICRYLDWPPMTNILLELIKRTSLPLRAIETDFAVDSTGFSTSRFVRWFDEKYGTERTGHDWVKVHIMAGVKTNVVTAVEVRGRNANDAPLFGRMVRATAVNFKISEVSADKAYSTIDNLEATIDVGGTPYIPFKDNATTHRGGLWEKMLLFYQLRREEFLQHYHKRSNIESTISMIKGKFRDHCRSRTTRAMKNEALAKILAHNICCVISSQIELGIEPEFWPDRPVPEASAPIEGPETVA